MTYDLRQMVKAKPDSPRRSSIRVRGGPKKLEKDLLAILVAVVNDPNGQIAVGTAIQRALGWLNSSAKWNLRQWEREVLSQLRLDLRGLATEQDLDPEVREAFEWLAALIRDLQEQTEAQIRLAQIAARAQNLSASEVRATVAAVRQRQRSRAALIAHDQTQKILAKINERQQVEAGITKYKWNHSFLPNARRHHVERQGNIYEWARPPRGGHPGTEINCRCTASPVLDV